MLRVAIRHVRPDHLDELRAWLTAVDRHRRDEALVTLADERCAHEQAVLIEGSAGPVLVQIMEVADVAHAQAVASRSPHPIDAEHKAVMRRALGDPVPGEVLLDLHRTAVDGSLLIDTGTPAAASEAECTWRGAISDDEMVELVTAHGGTAVPGWWDRVRPHSLGWVTAREGEALVGFVNVAWDGCDHAFLLDTKVRADRQHRGIGTEVVRVTAEHARRAGCEWLHVDFRPELRAFYLAACGFRTTDAGLIHLTSEE